MSAISRVLVAALAFSAAQALPQPNTFVQRADNGPTDNTALIESLKVAPTVVKRYQKLLTNDGKELLPEADIVKATTFDFTKNKIRAPGANGGTSSIANIESWPMLIGAGLQFTVNNLPACGLFVPHVHPRANEIFYVQDTEIEYGFVLETNLLNSGSSPQINGKLAPGHAVVFPQGTIHYQMNNSPGCKSANIVAALSSEDPGTTPMLLSPSSGVNMTANANVPRQADPKDLDGLRPLLPPALVSLVDQCFARCNIA